MQSLGDLTSHLVLNGTIDAAFFVSCTDLRKISRSEPRQQLLALIVKKVSLRGTHDRTLVVLGR